MNSNYRITATLYSLDTWFVSGICVNALRKDDDNDDDDDDDDPTVQMTSRVRSTNCI